MRYQSPLVIIMVAVSAVSSGFCGINSLKKQAFLFHIPLDTLCF